MKHSFAAAILVLSSLLTPQLQAGSPVRATLSLPHNDILPGVPFDLAITYTNVSDRPVAIRGVLATLIVTFENGETAVMHKPEVNDQWTPVFSPPVQLAPGESVQQGIGWENGSIPNWFRYGSFSRPGTYGIALELHLTNGKENVIGTIRTPPVTLNRIEPIGTDAELWKRMQQISRGEWTDDAFKSTKAGDALAAEIIQIHPTSGYYPYVLALRAFGRGADKSRIPALLEAAERFTDSPAYPYLLSAAAHCARHAAWRAQDSSEAQKYFALAEAKYREALATKSPVIRASAERGLADVAHGLEAATKKQPR